MFRNIISLTNKLSGAQGVRSLIFQASPHNLKTLSHHNSQLKFPKSSSLVSNMSTSSSPRTGGTRYFLITYKYPPDILERRAPHREAHLNYAKKFVNEGKLILGGALMDPIDSAVIVLKVSGKEEAEEFCRRDPYVLEKVALEWSVREWNVVITS